MDLLRSYSGSVHLPHLAYTDLCFFVFQVVDALFNYSSEANQSDTVRSLLSSLAVAQFLNIQTEHRSASEIINFAKMLYTRKKELFQSEDSFVSPFSLTIMTHYDKSKCPLQTISNRRGKGGKKIYHRPQQKSKDFLETECSKLFELLVGDKNGVDLDHEYSFLAYFFLEYVEKGKPTEQLAYVKKARNGDMFSSYNFE